MGGIVKTLIYGERDECFSVQSLIQLLFSEENNQLECRHVSFHDDLQQQLMDWKPCLTVVLSQGASGMEGVYAVKDYHPDSIVFWFSEDHGFAMMSHRLDCAYFSVKPVTIDKLRRAFRRCLHVGIEF